jgi:hypothetical protein
MKSYITTFFSHFGAMSYAKRLKKDGVPAKLMPVPRELSSSCGSCVKYSANEPIHHDDCEIDQIVEVDE